MTFLLLFVLGLLHESTCINASEPIENGESNKQTGPMAKPKEPVEKYQYVEPDRKGSRIRNTINNTSEKNNSSALSKKVIYYSGFQIKRVEQIAAVKRIVAIPDYGKQYKLVKILLEKLFVVLAEAKLQVVQSSYIPGEEFPEDKKNLYALGNVLENVAFFGDILLRLPDITHLIYQKSKEWELLVHWGISFCNETGIFDGANAQMLNLVAQELKLIPREPTYINPFKLEYQIQNKKLKEATGKLNDKKKSKRKSKKKKRKPKLSRTEL